MTPESASGPLQGLAGYPDQSKNLIDL